MKSKSIPKGITTFNPSLSDKKKESLNNSYRRNLTCFKNTMTAIDKTSQTIVDYTQKYRTTNDQGLKKFYASSIRFYMRNGNQKFSSHA